LAWQEERILLLLKKKKKYRKRVRELVTRIDEYDKNLKWNVWLCLLISVAFNTVYVYFTVKSSYIFGTFSGIVIYFEVVFYVIIYWRFIKGSSTGISILNGFLVTVNSQYFISDAYKDSFAISNEYYFSLYLMVNIILVLLAFNYTHAYDIIYNASKEIVIICDAIEDEDEE